MSSPTLAHLNGWAAISALMAGMAFHSAAACLVASALACAASYLSSRRD